MLPQTPTEVVFFARLQCDPYLNVAPLGVDDDDRRSEINALKVEIGRVPDPSSRPVA